MGQLKKEHIKIKYIKSIKEIYILNNYYVF